MLRRGVVLLLAVVPIAACDGNAQPAPPRK